MVFDIYDQKEMLAEPMLTDFLLDTMVENLSWLFGADMGSSENRRQWITYNLKKEDPSWHAVVGYSGGRKAGFLIYTVKERMLYVNDVEIRKTYRWNPTLLCGLFRTAFRREAGQFDSIVGYINRENRCSQENFLRLATQVEERHNGYRFVIGPEKTAEILEKLFCQR